MKRIWVILVLGLATALSLSAQLAPHSNDFQLKPPNVLDYVISPNSVVFSKTFSEWDVEWQQWTYSIPVANHPLFDNGDCSVGQSGMVWFLGGKYCQNNSSTCSYSNVQRSCTVPRGKYLYFPIQNGEDSAIEESVAEHPGDPNYQQIGIMRQGWDPWLYPPVSEFAIIDGVPVRNLMDYSVESSVFGFTIPDDNLLKALYPPPNNNFEAGTYYPAVDDGQYLMLAPLPPGKHVIHFGAGWGTGNFAFDVTYFLTVKK
jgi:hypothetical protein